MSEETSSSEPSSETAGPEPSPEPSVSPPPSGGKKKLWIVIAAVVVVALLLGSSVYMLFLAPMSVSVSPDEFSVDAGRVLTVSAKIKKGLSDLTDSDDVKILWTVSPNNLGSWQKRAEPTVNLTAGKVGATGIVYCNVTYKGETKSVSKEIEVKPPYLDQILVFPSTKTLDSGMAYNFSASAVDSVAKPIPGLSYTWSISGDVASECTLNTTTGAKVRFTAGSTHGSVTVAATASYGGATKTGEASVTVGPLPPRSVDYYWYDMFDVEFGEWWDMRAETYDNDVPLTDEYPYLFRWSGPPSGNTWIYSNMRLNITAENMTEVNMNEWPEFLPLSGIARGGTAVIDWYMQYLTEEEMKRFPDATAAWNDGWVVSLNGTVELDKQAALSVLKDLTSEYYDDFTTYWSQKKGVVKDDFGNFFKREAGKDRLDIYPAYDYPFTTLYWDIEAEKVGDKIVLHYDLVTWGMEVLLTMWMREAFMPTEWYFEDMNLHATIGPEWTTLNVETVVEYAVYAYEATNEERVPVWTWEALLQDYVWAAPPDHRLSLVNKYIDPDGDGDESDAFTYYNTAPGSKWYGMDMPYDYTPTAWNLTENETLRIDWPSGEQMFLVHVGDNETTPYYNSMILDYCEPYWSDADEMLPGTFSVVNSTGGGGTMVFTGPIDMWHWSQTQANPDHWWLSDEWERLEILPYGAPYIEWRPEEWIIVPDQLKLSTTTSWDDWEIPMVTAGETVELNVTILDNVRRIYDLYDHTVTFSVNDTTGVTLPDDYTFTPADGGYKIVSGLSFSDPGWYEVTVSDTTPETELGEVKPGVLANIWVVADAPVIDHFTVEVPGVNGLMIPGLPADVHVWAWNQYGNLFKKYEGTVTFSTNATPGTFTLPADYTFGGVADEGFAVIPGLMFDETGTYSVTVSDIVVLTATGETTVITSDPAQIDYRAYDWFEYPWQPWWIWRNGTVYNTELILNNNSGEYTAVYNPDRRNIHGIIMAPYRWNVSALNMSTVSVYDPAMMPVFGPDVEGASAHVDVYSQYLSYEWWDDYWVPVWSTDDEWGPSIIANMDLMPDDGYILGTIYTATMNREAAEAWMNMPVSADPTTWWADNSDVYRDLWTEWIEDQGNVEFDIWAGYEWPYTDLGTMMKLSVVGDDVVLTIAHINYGWEILILRWMTDRAVCVHEPYMEDFQLSAQFESYYANVTYDGVAQWGLHAVKANETDSDAAWVWNPQNVDYVWYEDEEPGDFNPYAYLGYTSWNSGDEELGFEVAYDYTPTYLNLTSYMTLTIEAPTGDDVIGYRGLQLPDRTIRNLRLYHITEPYEMISHYGEVSLGWHAQDMAGNPDLTSMWNDETKVLYIEGPYNFDNFHHPTGELYNSAPWIEFNISNLTWPGGTVKMASSPDAGEVVVVDDSSSASLSASVSSSMYAAMVALALAITLSIVATDIVVADLRTRKD
jgi:flagellar basal body-associated protein FliL